MAFPDDQPLPLRGQMDIWQCIDVAESGSDGKPTATPGTAEQASPTESRSGGEPSAPRRPVPTQRLSVAEVVRRRLEKKR
jgi:hypothetical protein